MADMRFNKSDRSIDYWLFFVMFLVVAMIVIGGATRLTIQAFPLQNGLR